MSTFLKRSMTLAASGLFAVLLVSCSDAGATRSTDSDHAASDHGEENDGHDPSDHDEEGDDHDHDEEGDDHDAEPAEGPHGGRLLTADGLEVEFTIFESIGSPELRLFAFADGAPLDPAALEATVELARLGGRTETISLNPRGDHLVGDQPVAEPHSFDVVLRARRNGRDYEWRFESYEGRTTISDDAAAAAGIEIVEAEAAVIRETIDLTGRISLRPEARAVIRARYRGGVLETSYTVGDRVVAGATLATVEAADTLQRYDIVSPIDGVVLERTTNVGDVAADQPLYVIADLSRLQAEFHVFPRDVSRVRDGQPVRIESLDGVAAADASIASFLPTAEADTQTLIARALINNEDGAFRPGMTVRGSVVINEEEAAVVVASDAVQHWRGRDVVFTRFGDTYEARPVTIGRRGDGLVEILEGLAPRDFYVFENSYLVLADIERAGASHDH